MVAASHFVVLSSGMLQYHSVHHWSQGLQDSNKLHLYPSHVPELISFEDDTVLLLTTCPSFLSYCCLVSCITVLNCDLVQ